MTILKIHVFAHGENCIAYSQQVIMSDLFTFTKHAILFTYHCNVMYVTDLIASRVSNYTRYISSYLSRYTHVLCVFYDYG